MSRCVPTIQSQSTEDKHKDMYLKELLEALAAERSGFEKERKAMKLKLEKKNVTLKVEQEDDGFLGASLLNDSKIEPKSP